MRMAVPPTPPEPRAGAPLGADLSAAVHGLVEGLVAKSDEQYEAEFVHLLARVRELMERKLRMEGTKTDTRDFLGELLFTRLRRGMQLFLRSEDEVDARRAAEWVMGVLFSTTTLTEFAKAFDQALIRATSGARDFNFAGRTDFISVEEVLQMLASGKHLGCLSLEKGDNRLDIYLANGRVWQLDPHHLIRRVLPGNGLQHREIPEAAVAQAEATRARTGQPVLLALLDLGVFKRDELRDWMRNFGKEVLFDFMREGEPFAFYYRKLDALPPFCESWDLRLGVTSILLEGSKLVDDWQQLLAVFPNPDAALEPSSDMFARMGDTPLGVLELKLLTAINGDMSPRALVPVLGLPLFDVYQMLVKLSRDGILAAPGQDPAAVGSALSVADSMQEAFAALDANDDGAARRTALDRAFGEAMPEDGPQAKGSAASALDRVLGGPVVRPGPAPAGDGALDQDLLAILRKGKA
jgi:hypothetical protein